MWALWFFVFIVAAASTDQLWVVQTDNLEALRHAKDVEYVRPGPLPGFHVVRNFTARLRSTIPGVAWAKEQLPRLHYHRQADPMPQWHLAHDFVNASHAWEQNITGAGIVLAIVDDGLEHTHAEFVQNYAREHSWDFNNERASPMPGAQDAHGTAAAGVAVAARNNGHCGAGLAYGARVAGLRLISAPCSDLDEATALGYHAQDVHIYSCSWGPPDDGKQLYTTGKLMALQFAHATSTGRGGKGSIYIWAGGNGRLAKDRSDYDAYANSPYTIAVGALAFDGTYSIYSEPGACLHMVMPSSGTFARGITTADLSAPGQGYSPNSECTASFGGTSSAAPLAAAMVALVLQSRPDLTWRDVQGVLAAAAQRLPNWPTDDWSRGTATPHHHDYGFGMVATPAALRVARNWTLWPPQQGFTSDDIVNIGLRFGLHNTSAACYETVFGAGAGNISFVEHVRLALGIRHPRRGDLGITLASPSGSVSVFSLPHNDFNADVPLDDWTFTSVHHWGEAVVPGPWTVCVADLMGRVNQGGVLDALRLSVYGH